MNPKMINKPKAVCKKWISCPLYDKCLTKAAQLNALGWTCIKCPYFKFASPDQIVEYKTGRPLKYLLAEAS